MDKRTLMFVFAMTAALLAINTFFSYWDQKRAGEWVEQQKARKEKQKQELLTLIEEKSVPFHTLPVVKIDGHYALRFDDQLIVIKEDADLPDSLTLRGKSYDLALETDIPNTPAVYTAAGAKKIPTKSLPIFGSYDLQLVFLDQKTSVFGEYRNSYVSLPIATLAEDFPEEFKRDVPKGSAVALLKMEGRYVPVGIYNSDQKVFTPLSDFNYLNDVLRFMKTTEAISTTNGDETFYVLENSYQQLVFSTRGGALTEVNLPFVSEDNDKSVVKPIAFDRQMAESNPQNAMFPSRGFYTVDKSGQRTFQGKGVLGGYYPLIRRNLIEKPPYESKTIPAEYYSLNIVSEFPEVANLIYDVTSFEPGKIVFEAKQPHRKIIKTYEIDQGTQDEPYVIHLTVDVEGDSRGLWLVSGVPEVEWISGAIAPALKYRVTKSGGKAQVDTISLPDPLVNNSTQIDWLTNSNGFFGLILDSLTPVEPGFRAEKVSGIAVPSRFVAIDQEHERFNTEKMPGYMTMIPLNKAGGLMKFRVVAGPFATDVLNRIDTTFSNPETGYNPDYIANQTFHGWFAFISEPFSKFLLLLLNLFHSFTGSWGFSIILLTLALRIMLWPLTAWSFKSQQKMQEVSPKLKEIQERYKKDPKKLQTEMSKIYREAGANPLGGCLPLLIQLPFLIGMFDLLKSTFELRGATFIPGWIDNLAAPDVLFSWSTPVFFIGNEFHLLPILMGLAMLAQTKLMARSKDPSTMSEQERQMQGMGSIMALLFGVFFYNAPSGLCIYWIFSTLFGMLQQKINQYQWGRITPAPHKPVEVEVSAEKKKRKRRR